MVSSIPSLFPLGSTVTAEIQGVIDACVKLTGMPDLTLSFMVTSRAVVNPVDLENEMFLESGENRIAQAVIRVVMKSTPGFGCLYVLSDNAIELLFSGIQELTPTLCSCPPGSAEPQVAGRC